MSKRQRDYNEDEQFLKISFDSSTQLLLTFSSFLDDVNSTYLKKPIADLLNVSVFLVKTHFQDFESLLALNKMIFDRALSLFKSRIAIFSKLKLAFLNSSIFEGIEVDVLIKLVLKNIDSVLDLEKTKERQNLITSLMDTKVNASPEYVELIYWKMLPIIDSEKLSKMISTQTSYASNLSFFFNFIGILSDNFNKGAFI